MVVINMESRTALYPNGSAKGYGWSVRHLYSLGKEFLLLKGKSGSSHGPDFSKNVVSYCDNRFAEAFLQGFGYVWSMAEA
jgi:hypothetical protein